jgi:hypothetical protein
MTTRIATSVAELLADQNPSAATRFARMFNCNAIDEKDEIRELNRFWRSELAALHTSTISARTCLVDDIAPTDWLRHFRTLVLPVVVSHDLPVRH